MRIAILQITWLPSRTIPGWLDDLCESLAPNLRDHFLEASVCFTTEDQEGYADVFVAPGERARFSFYAAAAVRWQP